MDSLHDLFEHELKDIYAAERQQLSIMQGMMRDCRDEEMAEAVGEHIQETKDQIQRIEGVFRQMNTEKAGAHCPAAEGLAKEVQEFRAMNPAPELRDPYNLGASVKGERYEISAYESVLDMAAKLGLEDVAAPLQQNLQEECAMLDRLKSVARRLSGPVAAGDTPTLDRQQRPV